MKHIWSIHESFMKQKWRILSLRVVSAANISWYWSLIHLWEKYILCRYEAYINCTLCTHEAIIKLGWSIDESNMKHTRSKFKENFKCVKQTWSILELNLKHLWNILEYKWSIAKQNTLILQASIHDRHWPPLTSLDETWVVFVKNGLQMDATIHTHNCWNS